MKPHFHARRLVKLLREKGRSLSPLTILTHDHPDPDSLASAWALAHLAQSLGRISDALLILSPHKRPVLESAWGWSLVGEIYPQRVRTKFYRWAR